MAVPPFGITGWAGPITAAGVMFPGWGWFGLAAAATGLLVMATRFWPIAALALGGAWAWSATGWIPPTVPDAWIGINTSFDYSDRTKANGYEQQLSTIAMVKSAIGKGYSVIVLPESALGTWTPTTERLWMQALKGTGAIALGGAIVPDAEGYDNVIIKVTATGGEILYRQRMPVPIAMWRPWTTGGAKAHFLENGTDGIAGVTLAPFICYEQLIVWPVLQSMLFYPRSVVAIGNGWWNTDRKIIDVQKAKIQSWSLLFGLQLIY